jgi:hypothetical protein
MLTRKAKRVSKGVEQDNEHPVFYLRNPFANGIQLSIYKSLDWPPRPTVLMLLSVASVLTEPFLR